MTVDELIAAKSIAAVTTVGAGVVAAVQAATPTGLPMGVTEIGLLVTGAIAWGNLNGRLKERETRDDKANKRRDQELRYLRAVMTRIAENQRIPIADLQAQLGTNEGD